MQVPGPVHVAQHPQNPGRPHQKTQGSGCRRPIKEGNFPESEGLGVHSCECMYPSPLSVPGIRSQRLSLHHLSAVSFKAGTQYLKLSGNTQEVPQEQIEKSNGPREGMPQINKHATNTRRLRLGPIKLSTSPQRMR